MSPAPRRPRLVQTSKHTCAWEWPDDAENVAEDARIAEVYHEQRLRERAEYDRKRAEYLRAVAAGTVGEVTTTCAVCGEPVYMGGMYCSNECAGVADAGEPRTVRGMAYTECDVCGKPVAQPAGHRGWERRYCSRKCKRRARYERVRERETERTGAA